MITVSSLSNKKYELFQSYHDLCEHINRIEKFKALETGKTGWRFIRRSYEALAFFYSRSPQAFEELCTPQEKEAFEKGLGLVEILRGEGQDITQVVFTSHLDVVSLKKTWCVDYCQEHGYTVYGGGGDMVVMKKN